MAGTTTSNRALTVDNLEKFSELGIDLPSRTFLLQGAVDDSMLKHVLEAMHYFSKQRTDKPINIYLSSTGGEVVHGLGIYDAFCLCPADIHITVFGSAESMAAIILQAGDWRRITRNSYLMIHQGDECTPEDSKRNVDAHLKNSRWLDKKCDTILIERIRQKRPKYTIEELQQETQFDKYLPPQEALNWGLVDEIV